VAKLSVVHTVVETRNGRCLRL